LAFIKANQKVTPLITIIKPEKLKPTWAMSGSVVESFLHLRSPNTMPTNSKLGN
jgi:hypothetical protein